MNTRIFITIALCALLCATDTMAKKHNDIYEEYKHEQGMMHMCLSFPLAKTALIGRYNKDARKLLKHVRKVNMLVYDGDAPMGSLPNRMAKSFDSENFKDLMTVNDGGDKIEFKIQQHDDYINELAMVVNDGSSLVIILLDGKIPISAARDFAMHCK